MDGNGAYIPLMSFVAAGTIYPSRVVKQSSAGDFEVAQATTGDVPFGIAQEYQRGAPGTPFADGDVAAVAGNEILVYTAGSTCRAAVKRSLGSFSNGDFVGQDVNGQIIKITSGWAVGKALESGDTGSEQKLRIYVMPQWVGSTGSGS